MSQGNPLEDRRICPVPNCQHPEDAAKSAVKHVFEILGVNVDDPEQVENFRKGLRFGEEMLKYSKRGKMTMFLAAVTISTGYVIHAIWNHGG